MSGWDWIHVALELATYTQVRNAQRNSADILLEAMKTFIFDISRDIQLAEEHIGESPQQVYIVSKTLDLRLANSGLSADLFPDFQDKEYVFKTQKKIAEVAEKSKAHLTPLQIQQSETAVKYVAEMPLLEQAVLSASSRESLSATDEEWQKLNNSYTTKSLLGPLGFMGLIPGCVVIAVVLMILATGARNPNLPTFIFIGVALLTVSIWFLKIGNKPIPEYTPMKANRETWQKQIMPKDEWQRVVSAFGDLTSEQFQKTFEERLAFLNPILGGDFQKNLTRSSIVDDVSNDNQKKTSVRPTTPEVETLVPEVTEREKVKKYGIEVVKCPSCGTINSLSFDKCVNCSTSLAKEKAMRNPYL